MKLDTIFNRLGITNRTLSISRAMNINKQSLEGMFPNDETELVDYILQKIMTLDSRYPEYLYSIDSEFNVTLHPHDILLAIFIAADDFLRQYIMCKLSICQLAVPFLIPNLVKDKLLMPIWALQKIHKSGQMGTDVYRYGGYIVEIETKVVVFLRYGKSKLISKSQVLNQVLSDTGHSSFIHRNMEGSTKGKGNSQLLDGVAEILWYIPGTSQQNIFDKPVAFVNLLGDASEHNAQVSFLSSIASVIVPLIASEANDKAKGQLKMMIDGKPATVAVLLDKETKSVLKKKQIYMFSKKQGISVSLSYN